MLTAKEAKEKATKILNSNIDYAVQILEEKIESAVNSGLFQIHVNTSIASPKLIQHFEKLGYDLDCSTPNKLTISWGSKKYKNFTMNVNETEAAENIIQENNLVNYGYLFKTGPIGTGVYVYDFDTGKTYDCTDITNW